MAVIEGRTGLEVMPPIGCERHLRTETIGRVAVLVDGHPEIFPVNYAVDDSGAIYFRTDRGTKLDAVAASRSIAFEIDGMDEEQQLGWSVLVVGSARRLSTAGEIAHAGTLPLAPWAAGEKANIIRLSPTKVSGRRIFRRHTVAGVEREV
jgi:nitroimidazol reductase NimA-like FMN-containing flavoprotein (pyridoxamine 5'-phosphate oxidase superfamily)